MALKTRIPHEPLVRSALALSGILAAWLCLPGLLLAQDARSFDKIPGVFDKKSPESLGDLRVIQDHIEKVVHKVMPCVVSVRVGASFGSGVIVSKDGYVLTAGHVSGEPGRDVTVYFSDGKKAKGKTLGSNRTLDSGLIKITSTGEWPYLAMGNSSQVHDGDWCMVIAHPGGFKPGRTPPVRLGRVLRTKSTLITTDCILVGGDSGGPLLDMHGKVIGINSKIGESLNQNMHVPVNVFRDGWDHLIASEVLGAQAWLGITYEPDAKGCIVKSVAADSPARKAGLKDNDKILTFDGKDVDSGEALAAMVQATSPYAHVPLTVQRGDETRKMTVTLGTR